MAFTLKDKFQRGLTAIVDEVDSILIDETHASIISPEKALTV
jgi:preprotein translocase subunit SecA